MLVTYLNRYAAACWLVILLLGTSSTTAATEAPNPSDSELDIPPVIVRGEMPAPAPAASTQSLTRQPSSAVRISSEDIQQSRGYNLEDVLRLAPGVVFQSRGGATDGKLNLRGTNLSSNINTWGITLLVNGLPFNAADGFAQLNTIDLQTVDHIEVYKGAQAIKFGANSLGGAINFVLKTGVNQAMVQVRGEGGSFGYYNSQLASGHTTKPFALFGETAKGDYYVSLTGNGQDGYRMNSQEHAVRFTANIGVTVGERHHARVTIQNANVNSQLPGPLTRTQFETNPRQAGAQLDVGGNPLVCELALPCHYTNDNLLNRIGVAYQYHGDTWGTLTVAPFYQYWKWKSNFTQVFDHLTQDTGAEVRYTQTTKVLAWIIHDS